MKILRPTEKHYYLDSGLSPSFSPLSSPAADRAIRGFSRHTASPGADWGKNGTSTEQGSAVQNKEEREGPSGRYGSYVTRLLDKLLFVVEKIR